MHQLVDQHLERLAWATEHLGERLQPGHVAVVVGAEHVDEPVESLRVLPAHIGGVGGEVRRRPVRANEHTILLVPVGGRPRPQRPVRLVGVEQRHCLGDLGLDDALPLVRVEMDAEPLQARLDQVQHARHRVALLARQVGHVGAPVAVVGRLLPAPRRFDRLAEAVHLRAGVVVVVLPLDVVAREGEQPCHGVAVGPVPGRRDGDRPRRVGGHHLDLHPLGRRGRAPAERIGGGDDPAEHCGEPGIVEEDVEEAGAGDLGPFHAGEAGDPGCELLGDLARLALQLPGEAQRDVRGVVPVRRVGRPFELDGHAGEPGEGAGEPLHRISLQRSPPERRDPRAGESRRACRRR